MNKFKEKMRLKIERFLAGRNGMDELARDVYILSIVVFVIGIISRFDAPNAAQRLLRRPDPRLPGCRTEAQMGPKYSQEGKAYKCAVARNLGQVRRLLDGDYKKYDVVRLMA